MRIHKEGYRIITITAAVATLISIAALCYAPWLWLGYSVTLFMLLWVLFVMRFFRLPSRTLPSTTDERLVYAPADGEVVAVEQTYEDECFEDERIQVSIFMSIWNVHANWYCVGGTVQYFEHHHGKFLVAWHPKSSTDNERTTTLVQVGSQQVMFRQIAGFVARRIVSYARVGSHVHTGEAVGFIKFGSRVDIFLPLGTHVNVKLGDETVGRQTIIAKLPPCK